MKFGIFYELQLPRPWQRDGELKLYSLYSPPEHPDGTVHRTKADAEAAEAS